MDILDLAQRYVKLTRSGNRYSGACPKCGGSAKSNKFSVYVGKDDCHCFSCGLHGDAIALLRAVEGVSCPDAHEQLSIDCKKRDCPFWDKCRLGARANGEEIKKEKKYESLQPPVEKAGPDFTPAEADTPKQIWMRRAAELVEKAHTRLLDCPEQLDFLTARGIPLEAIKKGQFGWLADDRFPSRESWGLPTELKENGIKKKMLIPAGILIPFFDVDGNPHRIRIRRSNPPKPDEKYYWLQGSGNDVPVIGGADRRGVVVVESDLDAFMVRWQCRDLDVSVIPLGTCCAKPKGWAMQALEQALAILVAHDFEPRINEKNGKPENPGGQGARWWLQQFSRAKRWPVPAGKDPGEYYQDHGGDIRKWVLDGLPPVFHVKYQPPKPQPRAWKLRTSTNLELCIVKNPCDKKTYAESTGLLTLDESDLACLKQMDDDAREEALKGMIVFGGSVKSSGPISQDTADWYQQIAGERLGQQENSVPLPVELEIKQEILNYAD